MIAANKVAFSLLDSHAKSLGVPVGNEGSDRWIATTNSCRQILKDATVEDRIVLSSNRQICRLKHRNTSYFCIIGFSHSEELLGLKRDALTGGIATLVISELKLKPTASASEIRDVVEYSDRQADGLNYQGHDHSLISNLFPPIHVLKGDDVDDEATSRVVFYLCALEAKKLSDWISDDLFETLRAFCETPELQLPYETLCRSIFDHDRSAVFLSLYRCLEALYAYSSAKKVRDSLKLTLDWHTIAATLEDELGWFPREANALEELLQFAGDYECKSLFAALNVTVPRENLKPSTASLIYRTRNALVHYRSGSRKIDLASMDWASASNALATIVWYVYSEVFE